MEITATMVQEAISAMRRYRFSFWDSLNVQAALQGGATILYSEDFQHGGTIETLVIENPFRELSV